jgi:hypothetical protein
MKYLRLFVAILIAACSIFAARYPNDEDLSQDETTQLLLIIAKENNPEKISAIWGEGRRIRNRLVLLAMIAYKRNESFKLFFPRTTFVDRQETMVSLLNDAYEQHNFEIFSYMLTQDFPLGTISIIWDSPWIWQVNELKEIAAVHPERLRSLLPELDRFSQFTKADHVLSALDFINHCTCIDEDIANDPEYNPRNVLAAIIRNLNLSEDDITNLIHQAIQFGAEVDQKLVDTFKELHCNKAESLRVLVDACNSFDIKDPGCD